MLLTVTAAAAAQSAGSTFQRWDANGDGRLTREELPAQARGNFDRADTDGDGFISPEEDRQFRNRNRSPRQSQIPDSIRLITDVPYADSGNPRQTLDVLLPKEPKSDAPLPVIAFIHGGGWRNGNKGGGRNRLVPYVESGEYAGVTIGYRLSGEARWPVQIHDCKAAIRWIRGHAEEYGFDPEKIGVIGTSAGGHLVSMLGVSGGVFNLEGDLGSNDDQSSRVTCVVNMYGPSELLTMDDHPGRMTHNAPDSPESKLIGGPIQEHKEITRAASPVTHVTKDDAPFLHIHGTEDPLVPFPQSEALHKLLTAAGVPSLLVPVVRGEHGGFNNPEVERRTRLFFDRHLRGQDVDISDEPIEQRQRP
jgi:acetyl esterase/lipase